jgi:dihydropteroate synthase
LDARRSPPPVQIWGVLNVTPDSFSDGGLAFDEGAAVAHAERMLAEGADVVDVGGESSRPAGRTYGEGAERVSADEECRRVLPVIERLVRELRARVSIDTVKGEVARRALDAGASVVNDVSGGEDPELLRAVAAARAEIVLMHNRGRGDVTDESTRYGDVVADVVRELGRRVERASEAGIARDRIWIDPGIGFAKTARQSVELIARADELVDTGHPVLLGPSRKSFIAELAAAANGERPPPDARLPGTAAAITIGVLRGVQAVRVHDVGAMRQTVRIAEAAREARR